MHEHNNSEKLFGLSWSPLGSYIFPIYFLKNIKTLKNIARNHRDYRRDSATPKKYYRLQGIAKAFNWNLSWASEEIKETGNNFKVIVKNAVVLIDINRTFPNYKWI